MIIGCSKRSSKTNHPCNRTGGLMSFEEKSWRWSNGFVCLTGYLKMLWLIIVFPGPFGSQNGEYTMVYPCIPNVQTRNGCIWLSLLTEMLSVLLPPQSSAQTFENTVGGSTLVGIQIPTLIIIDKQHLVVAHLLDGGITIGKDCPQRWNLHQNLK